MVNAEKLKKAKLIFWDFDGVIKESTEIKTDGFRQLFYDFGEGVFDRVVSHHLQNQGVSRREKIKLYLSWCGFKLNNKLVDSYCNEFKKLVYQGVLDSPWVPGVREYIIENYRYQKFIVVSSMPEDELSSILGSLDLKKYFAESYGYPSKKNDTIKIVLMNHGISPLECLFIGDANSDLDAADENNVPFVLRKTSSNQSLQESYKGLSFYGLR